MFTIGDKKVLNLPEQVEENVKSIDALRSGVESLGDSSATKAELTALTSRVSTNEGDIVDLKARTISADDVLEALKTADLAVGSLTSSGAADVEGKLTAGADVEIDGTLTINSRDSIKLKDAESDSLALSSELTADKNALDAKIEANSALIDAKQDKGDYATNAALASGLAAKQGTLTAGTGIAISDSNEISSTLNAVDAADYDASNAALQGVTIGGTAYKLMEFSSVKATGSEESVGIAGGMVASATYADTYSGALAIGVNANSSSAKHGVAIGASAAASAEGSAALGYEAKARSTGAVAIGRGAYTTAGNSPTVAVGYNSQAMGTQSTALGGGAHATASGSVALGASAVAGGQYATALGDNAYAPVGNWVCPDGTSDSYVRTLSLKSPSNVFFRNENVSADKTAQSDYSSGKTLQDYLDGVIETASFTLTFSNGTANSSDAVQIINNHVVLAITADDYHCSFMYDTYDADIYMHYISSGTTVQALSGEHTINIAYLP